MTAWLLAYVRIEAGENAIWLRQMATGSVVRVVGPRPNTIANLQFTPDDSFLFYSENTTIRPIRYTLMAAPACGGTAGEVAQGRFLSRRIAYHRGTTESDIVLVKPNVD